MVMEYFVYILYSEKTDRYYVGQTQNLDERLVRHNTGRNKSTKPGIPLTLVHFEPKKFIKNLGWNNIR